MEYPGLRGVDCTIQRSGTSKGVFFLEKELPREPEKREAVILAAFGSPDRRQIDGLGGADPLTSKTAIVGASDREDADVEYVFGQVSIDEPKVYYQSLCGNITSGVGPFAVNHGLVKAKEGITTVRMYNRNTGSIILAEVPTHNGRAVWEGDFAIAGVPGTGAKVTVDYSQCVGALSGRGLLPTGRPIDRVNIPDVGELDVSIVDIGACQVYVRASDLGLEGTESPKEVDGDPALLRKLEKIRAYGAWLAGLADTPEAASTTRRNSPHVVMIAPPKPYRDHLKGTLVSAEQIDLTARMMFMQIMHKTYAGSGSICTAAASGIPGTIPWASARHVPGVHEVRIGHPAGVISVEAEVEQLPDGPRVKYARVGRTVRTIMEGQVYVPEKLFA